MINRRKFLIALGLSLIAPEMLFSEDSSEIIHQHRDKIIRKYGVPESIVRSDSLSGWSNRAEFKIDGDYINTDLDNFPIHIEIPHLRANGSTVGYVYFDYSKSGVKRLSPVIGTITWKDVSGGHGLKA